ncbi:hypothetical protein QTG54_010267 [Skeletonema marinoi]|uniref:Alpha-1,3-glucosyltransferase n=1 Tax=Skeletonema marinoi TaxID=267567 RepID=A0AAD8Y3F5_9STRA|nr:hypothetical protein QTG54_010267 [Skeletonema marinoi]
MEITYHLPISEWYWHSLEYWGLDYPPLTAYVSWVCGFVAHNAIKDLVALHSSRFGYEDALGKMYMRFTVLLLDLLVYMSAVIAIAKRLMIQIKCSKGIFFVKYSTQPALLLIDHGHFQYNTTSLGLALWSFYFMTQTSFVGCVIGSVCSVLL